MRLHLLAGSLGVIMSLTGCSDSMRQQILGGLPGIGGESGSMPAGQIFSAAEDLYKAATLSDEDVQSIAREQIVVMDQQNKLAPPDSSYSQRLAKLSKDLAKEDGLTLNYKVYLTSDVNAFSMPDGSIRVYSGLMDRMNDDELKFILGHEVAHIKNGHRKSRLKRAYAANAAVKGANSAVQASASSSVGGAAAIVGGDLLASMAAEVITAQFSQSDETECDEYGLELLTRYNAPKEASITALVKLSEGGKGGSGDLFASLTSSHPDPLARAKHMQDLIPELAGGPDLTTKLAQSAPTDNKASVQNGAGTPAESISGSDQIETQSEVVVVEEQAPPNKAVDVARAPVQAEPQRRSEGWYIQVGAYANKDFADRAEGSITSKQYKIAQYPFEESGRTVYRVLVGPFPSHSAAKAKLHSVAEHPQMADAFLLRLSE